MSQNDLEMYSSKPPAVVGGRKEIVDYLLRVARGDAPARVYVNDDPHRVALKEERRHLLSVELDRFQAAKAEAKAERLRAWEPELKGIEDEFWREMRIEDLEEELEELERRRKRREPEPPATPNQKRLVEIEDELRSIEETERQLVVEAQRRVAQLGRRMLEVPAGPDIIKLAVERLARQHKWATVIDDRAGFLSAMCETLDLRSYPAVVLARVVANAATKYDWIPSIKEFVTDCEALAGDLDYGIWRLESGQVEPRKLTPLENAK
jgi:hypothetical protein